MSRTIWKCSVTGEAVDTATCFQCSRRRERPECPWTFPFLRALARTMETDPTVEAMQTAGITVIRASSLTGCVRKAWYASTEPAPLESPDDLFARFRGVMFHEIVDKLGRPGEVPGVLAERRLVVSLAPWGAPNAVIAGRVDFYDEETRTLVDLKSINVRNGKKLRTWDSLPKAHHVRQLVIYAWLLEQNGYAPPERAYITYISMGDVHTVEAPLPAPEKWEAVSRAIVNKALEVAQSGPKGPEGKPRESWECRYCAYRPACPYSTTKKEE